MTEQTRHTVFKRPDAVAILLWALAILLWALQYATLARFDVLSPGRSYGGPLRFYQAVAEAVEFTFVDGLLFGGAVAAVLALVGLEASGRRFTLYLRDVFQSEKKTRLLLLVASAVAARYYFAPGELSWAGDAPHHIALAWVTAEAMAGGAVPFWTYYFGTGSPYLQFYGPLFFYAAGLIDLVLGDIYQSIKLLLGAAHIASGMGLYLLARRLGCRRGAGLFAGLSYVLCFWHVQQVLVMGRLALGLFYTLLPWPFYFFERLRASRRPFCCALAGGAALAALVYAHPGYGFFAVGLFGLYAVGRLWVLPARGRRCGYSALLLGCGLVLSAYLLLGMWVERGYSGLGGLGLGLALGGQGVGAQVPDPTWRHLLIWSNYRFWLFGAPDHWYGGYLGLSVVGVGALGVVAVLRRRVWAPVGIGLVVALALVFLRDWPPLCYIEVVQAMNSARFLLFAVFFLALAGGFGVRALQLRFKNAVAPLLLALCLDLGPTTLQQPYVAAGTDALDDPQAPWYAYRTEAAPHRVGGALPPYRVSWLRGAVSHFTAVGFVAFAARTPTPDVLLSADLAPGRQFSQPLADFAGHVIGSATRFESLDHSRPFALAKAGFAMLNVRHLLLTWRDGGIRPIELAEDTPVLVAPRIEGYTEGELARVPYAEMAGRTPLSADDPNEKAVLRMLWTVEKTGADAAAGRAARILLKGGDARDLGGRPDVLMREHRVENQHVTIALETSAPCFARLAYAYYPYMDVLVNGVAVRPLQTVGGFIALELGQGPQRIELAPRLSPLRRALLWLNGLVLCAGAGLALREYRRTI